MRTTIELRDDQRARLLEMAAREGRKGFSHLIQEAVDRFLEEDAGRQGDGGTGAGVGAQGGTPPGFLHGESLREHRQGSLRAAP
jgi:hypothetical protein